MEKSKVSIVKTQNPHQGVRQAVALLGSDAPGFRSARVLVKPNICSPYPPEENPSNTHPDVIGAMIRYLRDQGAQKVYVGDEPVWGLNDRFCYEKSGVKAVTEREGGELVSFDDVKRIKKKVPQGRIYRTISLPAILEEVDLVINLPKMKTSAMALVTLCIKNQLGYVPFRNRKQFHRGVDLSYALVDIAKVVYPDLNLIDGIIASEGMGAHGGTTRPMGILVASRDMVAADIVGTQLMGFDPLEPVTNQLALKDGLGVKDPSEIAIVGERLEDVRARFGRPVFRLVHPKPNVEVIPGGICPGCLTRIPRIPPRVDADKQYGVVIGKRVRYPQEREFDEIWCFGDCGIEAGEKIVAKSPHLKKRIKKVKGCPPLDWWCEQTMMEELKEKGWIT